MAEVRRRRAPLFGVCLGMQAIALEAGGVVARGRPVHGRTSAIHHNGTGLFAGLPSPFRATRYHSLRCVALPPSLDVTARSSDGTAMALHSRIHPAWGVQFHPESVRTQLGPRLCANVLALATARGSL